MMLYDKYLVKKITEAGIVHNIHYLAGCYGVSTESVRVYKKRHNKYPALYIIGDNEKDILEELTQIDRVLKIKKIKDVR